MADTRAIESRWSGRLVCPTHGIPDCSALLNGCTVPAYLNRAAEDVAALVELLRAVEALADELEAEAGRYRIAEPVHWRHLADATEKTATRLRRAAGVHP